LRAAGVQPVLLPGSVYALGSARYPAARAMIEAGLAVVWRPTSTRVVAHALDAARPLARLHAHAYDARRSLTAATVNAAYSLGRGRETGSLEVGKRADFLSPRLRGLPRAGYFFGIEHAHAVYVGGRLGVSSRRLK
jgi:imidazolonepropionase